MEAAAASTAIICARLLRQLSSQPACYKADELRDKCLVSFRCWTDGRGAWFIRTLQLCKLEVSRAHWHKRYALANAFIKVKSMACLQQQHKVRSAGEVCMQQVLVFPWNAGRETGLVVRHPEIGRYAFKRLSIDRCSTYTTYTT